MALDGRAETLRRGLLVAVSGYSPALVELFTDDVVGSSPVLTVANRDELVSELRRRDRVFSDIEVDYHATELDDGRLLAEWSLRATHTGTLRLDTLRLPPSGRRIALVGVTIARFLGSQIREFQQYWDALVLLQQLGALPVVGGQPGAPFIPAG